ncbi:MAG TPA: HDOD domain-containing protein [Kofleriaceae bacterium]|nr:HDOD domain-containing protein [Kofleriaceae bacterium]
MMATESSGLDLSSALIQQLRSTEVRIPPYPAVALSLDRLSRDPKSTLTDVTSIIAADAALAATVLRYASAASMKSSGPVTLDAAVRKLGLEELTRVVIATTVGASATKPGPLSLLRRDQWRRSLLSAMFCRELAGRRGVLPDQAFLGGLLHDFGAVVVLACLEALGKERLPTLSEATWRRLVEDLHIEFGMIVVTRWQLPEPIAEVVAHHHTPHTAARSHRSLVQLVSIVDQIIAVLDRGSGGGIAALLEVPGLEQGEHYRIGALMPKVAEHMARFESPPQRDVTSAIAVVGNPVEDGWPVDFFIESKSLIEYRACTLTPSTLAFRAPSALQPAWLTELTLRCTPDTITMLANVKTCEALPSGEYFVTAQPFGLAGEDKAAWLRLIDRTRRGTQR